jgi:tetratricopeptide (TPR) repeat protein
LLDSALELSRRSLELAETPEAILLHASALTRLRRYQEVLSFASEKLADSTMVARLLLLRRAAGTAAWALGDRERARREFDILRRTNISIAWSEDAALRLHFLSGEHPSALFPYFAGEVADSLAVGFLSGVRVREGARDPALSYLLGLAYSRQGSTDSAIAQFTRARFDDLVLEFSRHRRIAVAEFGMGRFQKAKAHVWEARNYTWSVALELDLDSWIRRCDWMSEKARSDPHTRTLHGIDAPGRKLIFAQILRLLMALHSPMVTNTEFLHGNDNRSLGAGDPGLARQSYD